MRRAERRRVYGPRHDPMASGALCGPHRRLSQAGGRTRARRAPAINHRGRLSCVSEGGRPRRRPTAAEGFDRGCGLRVRSRERGWDRDGAYYCVSTPQVYFPLGVVKNGSTETVPKELWEGRRVGRRKEEGW